MLISKTPSIIFKEPETKLKILENIEDCLVNFEVEEKYLLYKAQ